MYSVSGIVKHLLIINVIIYFTASSLSQYVPELSLYFPLSEHFEPYQIVTHMFMHGSISHLAFNMLSLFFLGPYVERVLGAQKFFTFYILCGFGAMFAHMGIDFIEYVNIRGQVSDLDYIISDGREIILGGKNFAEPLAAKMNQIMNIPIVGASGAIYGVLVAFATLFPNVKLMLLFPPIPVKAKYLAIGLIIFDLLSGFSHFRTGIAHFAHVGGAIAGFLLIMMWKKDLGR